MQWAVTYKIDYPDFPRNGKTNCPSRKAAIEWVEAAKVNNDFLELSVMFGPQTIGIWKRENGKHRLQRVWKQI